MRKNLINLLTNQMFNLIQMLRVKKHLQLKLIPLQICNQKQPKETEFHPKDLTPITSMSLVTKQMLQFHILIKTTLVGKLMFVNSKSIIQTMVLIAMQSNQLRQIKVQRKRDQLNPKPRKKLRLRLKLKHKLNLLEKRQMHSKKHQNQQQNGQNNIKIQMIFQIVLYLKQSTMEILRAIISQDL